MKASVQILGRPGLLYKEKDFSIQIGAEALAKDGGFAVHNPADKEWVTKSGGFLDNSKCEQILENIKRALAFRNIDLYVFPAFTPLSNEDITELINIYNKSKKNKE